MSNNTAPTLALVPLFESEVELVPRGTLLPVADDLLRPQATRRAEVHPACVYLASLSAGSRRTMREALETIAKFLSSGACDMLTFPWTATRIQHTQAVRAHLAESYKPATAKKMLCALKGCLKQAWLLHPHELPSDEYQRAITLKPISGKTQPKGRMVSDAELQRLFEVCWADSGLAGARDAAMIAVGVGCGLRRAELNALLLSDYKKEAGELHVQHGKGNKFRTLFVGDDARDALEDWIELRGDIEGALFTPLLQGRTRTDGSRPAAVPLFTHGDDSTRFLSEHALIDLLRKRVREVNQHDTKTKMAAISPHDLRRTYASKLIKEGVDLNVVRQMMGHESIETTARYDKRGDDAQRAAAKKVRLFKKRAPQAKLF